jgi:hypothetical protein
MNIKNAAFYWMIVLLMCQFITLSCSRCEGALCDEDNQLTEIDIIGLWYNAYVHEYGLDSNGDTLYSFTYSPSLLFEFLDDELMKEFVIYPDEYDLFKWHSTEDSIFIYENGPEWHRQKFSYVLQSENEMIWEYSELNPILEQTYLLHLKLTKLYLSP